MILNKKSDDDIYVKVREDGRISLNGIDIVHNIKYLGVLIDDKRNCFESQKKRTFENTTKYKQQIYSVLGNCYNRLLIGKTFWKGLILPNLLYASDVIVYTKNQIKSLQILDNFIYKQILQVPSYTATCFLRGEVGASSSIARDIKSKVLFFKHAFKQKRNPILKIIIEKELNKPKMKWSKQIVGYFNTLGLSKETIVETSDSEIEKIIKIYDTDKWRAEMEAKSTLKYYREGKIMITEEKWFKNGEKYSIMMKIRSNTLKLNWREKDEHNKVCKLCNNGIETLNHFILDCVELQNIRNQCMMLQLPRNEKSEEILTKLLLLESVQEYDHNYFINLVYKLKIARDKKLKTFE